jgi:hypothetical protein
MSMQYTLTGFTHDAGFRVFAFEGIGEGRVRLPYSVKVDMALARKYGIGVQELPLLCREVLEQRTGADGQAFTYLECDLSVRATAVAEMTERRRKAPRARQVVTEGSQIFRQGELNGPLTGAATTRGDYI